MFSEKQKIREIYNQTLQRIKNIHIGCFKNMGKPLFLISDTYPGIWLEHVYDSVLYAKLDPSAIGIAKNTVNIFIDNQKEDGQLPCYIWDEGKFENPPDELIGYGQIQECVSFAQLGLEVCEMSGDRELTEKVYKAAEKWDAWLRNNRMTLKRGLIEMFVGYDTGHDNSGRLQGLLHPDNYISDGKVLNAGAVPQDNDIAPIIAVDMNCNFYATQIALSKLAEKLGLKEKSEEWKKKAEAVKQKLFEVCFDEKTDFFYDVDKNNNKRKYLSSTIFHLFLEKVLDKEKDGALIKRICEKHIKNPDEFWTAYPFPSMAVCDPSVENHAPANCWGYFSQGLIALRCIRWMDYYGMSDDFDTLCRAWVNAWTDCFDEIKLGQELDPFTGKPSKCSEWYSSCMLFYIYSVQRLKLI